MCEAPENIWLSSADSDNERQIWTDPDEGGTEYVRADLAETFRAENERLVERGFDLISERDAAKAENVRLISSLDEATEDRNRWQARAQAAEAQLEEMTRSCIEERAGRLAAEARADKAAEALKLARTALQGEACGRTWYEQTAEALERVDDALASLPTESKDAGTVAYPSKDELIVSLLGQLRDARSCALCGAADRCEACEEVNTVEASLSAASFPTEMAVTGEMIRRFIEVSRDDKAGYTCWTDAVSAGLRAALQSTGGQS